MSDLGRRAKEVFLDASEKPQENRAAFVREACGGDEELLARVHDLLLAHEHADVVLGELGSSSGPSSLPLPEEELAPGARIGAFRLVEEIGEGGFGSVWRAEQEEPVRRTVAIKVLKLGLGTREVVARFEAERQALALMDHPCIARVYDGGATERGRPWFAMELVDGEPITDACTRRGLTLRGRLRLFLDVCRAVQHAHQKGVVHRDIKPSNVMVVDLDGQPLPKVIDFGIAKAVEQRLTDKSVHTIEGQMIGTPAYMSPEQVGGSPDIDTRADVYALGVLLYELLCGSTPFADSGLGAAGLAEVARIILETEPPRPSTRMARANATTLASRDVRGDLDWIVMRCLEKDPERRYDSVSVLANEIDRYLRGEPVLAGPPDLGYRSSKFVRRHRVALSVGAAMVALLVGGTLAATLQAARARSAEETARLEAEHAREAESTARAEAEHAREAESSARLELSRSEEIAGVLEHVLMSIDPALARGMDAELMQWILRQAAIRVDGQTLDAEVEATVRRVIGGAYLSIGGLEQAEKQLGRALELREQALPPDDLDVLTSLEDWGGLLMHRNRYGQAGEALARCLEGRRRLLGDEHERTLNVLGLLAVQRRYTDRLEEAETLLRELERTYRRTLGEDHADTLMTRNNLAGVLDDQGRRQEAAEIFADVLALQVETVGESHPRTLATMNNLAGIYMDQDRRVEALEMLERAHRVKTEVLPPGHPSLLVSLNNLASLYEVLGRAADARPLYDDAVAASLETLGPEHPTTLSALLNRGLLLESLDQLEPAEADLRRAVEGCGEHADVSLGLALSCESALGWVLLRLDRPDEAAVLTRRPALAGREAHAQGSLQPGIYTIRHGLALAAVEREQEALEVLLRGHEHLHATREREWTERARARIAELYDRLGDYEEAQRWGLH